MSADSFSLATNILVYALDARAGPKHALAAEIVDRAVDVDCRLTLQSLSEFYAAVTRKSLVAKMDAATQVEDWLAVFPCLAATPDAMRAALACAAAGRASYWDALLVATAGEGGCEVVLSEDMADGAKMDGVTIINPFNNEAWRPLLQR